MTITEMVDRCYQQARDKGWTEKLVIFPEQISLIHSEVSEALECYREGQATSWTTPDGKPSGVASEFADILIRVGHYSKLNRINLEYEVLRKLEYNMTRPHRHGGKVV